MPHGPAFGTIGRRSTGGGRRPAGQSHRLAALTRAKLTGSRRGIAAGGAWNCSTQKNFDLFLFDVEMPHLNGYELCRKLRAMDGYERTPVIYVTSHSDFENHAKSILAGGND
jgi:CheY-like chemotaxis protein